MNKLLIIATTLASVGAAIVAWQWIVVFEPSNPIVPLGLMFLSGFAFRQAFD